MLRIGLTGGIAAGKSVVAHRFAVLGAVVVDADVLARAAVERGSDGLDEIVDAFGRGILTPDGDLDRPAMGRLVFADSSARERLNAIVHPRVRAGAGRLIGEAPDDAVVVEDIPLLVETGQAARFHLVVVVDAPDDLRVQRMVEQRGMDRTDAEQRIAAQSSRADRLREADAVLANDRGLEEILASTDALWHARIAPFRDNLAAGRAAARRDVPPVTAGLVGTSGLGRRVRRRVAAALPPGSSVEPRSEPEGQSASVHDDAVGEDLVQDDVRRAEVRVLVEPGAEPAVVSDAVAAAGFPRVEESAEQVPADGSAVHRSADPGVDVTVLIGFPTASA